MAWRSDARSAPNSDSLPSNQRGPAQRLDHIRKVTSLRKGEDVSTSEIAKQLLESSPADRLEVTELIREPTECLLRIRKKCEAEQPLSLAEWTVLAYYVQQGADAICNTPVSRESCIAFLEAFQAVYKLRKNPTQARTSITSRSFQANSDQGRQCSPPAPRRCGRPWPKQYDSLLTRP